MSTVLAYTAPSDLDATALGEDSIQIDWSQATPIYVFANGNAEVGSMSGWTSTLGAHVAVSTSFGGGGVVNPPQGSWQFDGGQGNASSKSQQRFCPLSLGLTIDQIDNDAIDLTVLWWGGSFIQSPGDQPQLNVLFYDGAGSLISTYNSGFKTPTTTRGVYKWNEYTEVPTIPVGTRFIDIQMDSKRNAGGAQTYNDGAFDDIRFSLDATDTWAVPGYAIYRDGALIDSVAADVTTFTDTGLDSGTTYSYVVVAYDGANFLSGNSNTASVSTDGDTIFVEGAFAPARAFAPSPVGVSGFGDSFVNGAFAGARAFAPVMIANMRGARPRIYMPLENVTVRTGR